jgi:polyisoprenoid-binding protein YceI
MNKGIFVLIGVVLLAGGWYVFTKEDRQMNKEVAPETTQDEMKATKSVPASGMYEAVVADSTVMWSGQKPLVAGYVHKGTIMLSEGMIEVKDGTAAGSFTIDMNSIKATSLGGGKEGQESGLEKHLKSKDFFNVETYPTATMKIASVTPIEGVAHRYTVVGELTLLGKTNAVTFPADIYTKEDGTLMANATVSIDRTVWGITYGSGSFFDNLANNAIDNNINLDLSLVAKMKTAETEGSAM